MELRELRRQVARFFLERADDYAIDRGALRVEYVLNWGGFMNASFTIDGGAVRYHLKLADEPGQQAALRRWQRLRRILEERYHAPRIVDWIDLPGTSHEGPLFEHVAGRTGELAEAPVMLNELIEMVARLHGDRELAERLRAEAPERTYADCFRETYIERFTEDLEIVEGARPEFVSESTAAWMREETEGLSEDMARIDAFAATALAPTHGDLHPNNTLLDEKGDWFVVDWDDLSLGDPAIEYAILLWPELRAVWSDRPWRDIPAPRDDDGFDERMALGLRAQLLDEVIDTLADYVEADKSPDHAAFVRRVKRVEHESALVRYRFLYG